MGSPWLSKKAFLYFGGAFVLLLGGAIVILAPYHYTGFVALPGDSVSFEIWDRPGYHPELEIAVIVNPDSNGTVYVNIRVIENVTLETDILNMSLTTADRPEESASYEQRQLLNIDPGDYTIYIDSIIGAADIDISLTQISDSRTYIVIGGAMNIIGLFMGAMGYCVGGSVIPSGNETIVEWGFDEHQRPK